MALDVTTMLVSGSVLTASFTTDIAWLPYHSGSFHVVWTGVTGNSAKVKLQGYNAGFGAFAANVTTMPSAYTLLTEGGTAAFMFNLKDQNYQFIRFSYLAGNNAAGSMSVRATKVGYGA